MKLLISDCLKNQLRQFGLNPNDWKLCQTSTHQTMRIIHKSLKDFQLYGRWEASTMAPNWRWKHLSLESVNGN